MPNKDEEPCNLKAAVADSSAFIQGFPISGAIRIYTTPLIDKEVEGVKGIGLLHAAAVEIMAPSDQAITMVREGAKRTGDDARLSEADIEVLALAFELGLSILTDDYSIQNLARHLKVTFIPVREKGITEEIKWTYRCRGCRKIFDERIDECPICGSEVKSSRGGRPKGK